MSRRSSSRRSRNKGRGSRYSPGSPDHSSAPPISMWPKQYAHQDAARPGALSNSLTDQLRNASTDSRASGIDVIHRYRPPNRSSLHCSGQRNHDQYSAAHGYLATPRASQVCAQVSCQSLWVRVVNDQIISSRKQPALSKAFGSKHSQYLMLWKAKCTTVTWCSNLFTILVKYSLISSQEIIGLDHGGNL